MLTEPEVALRLAADVNIDRKLRTASHSKFFWIYSLSLWDPEVFWRCIFGASVFSAAGLLLIGTSPVQLTPTSIAGVFEYFIFGLILMWLYYLKPWLQPTNFKVIVTLVFRLYRKRKSVDDLSAEEIAHLFRPLAGQAVSTLSAHFRFANVSYRIERSPVLGSLFLGLVFALLLVGLLTTFARL